MMLGGDAVPWLRNSDEPAARLVTLTSVVDGARTDPDVLEARFETLSCGQKKRSSPLATALLLTVLRRLNDLAPAAAAVDATELASSKGGRGTAVPPPA